MEVKKTDSDYIDCFTLETICFLKKLQLFHKKSNNQISKNLTEQFNLILDTIEDIIDSDPELVKTKESNILENNFDFDENIITKFYCTFCKCLLVNNVCAIDQHIKQKHLDKKITTSQENESSKQKVITDSTSKSGQIIMKPILFPSFPVPAFSTQNQFPLNQDHKIPNEFLKNLQSLTPFNNIILELLQLTEKINLYLDEPLKNIKPIKAYIYGSRAIGLANTDSKFDFHIEAPTINNLNSKDKVKLISEYLQKHKDVWRTTRQNRNDRIPSTEVINLKLNRITCRFTFENGVIYKTQADLVNYYFEIPIIRKVATMMKIILNKAKVNLKAYPLSMLIIYFYQNKGLLPPIQYLQTTALNPMYHGLWQINFNKIDLFKPLMNLQDNYMNCFIDVKSFCSFYLNFDFGHVIICPYLGGVIQKKDFFNLQVNALPRYHAFYLQDPSVNSLNIHSTQVCIQDPIQQNINVTEDITLSDLQKFKAILKIFN